MDYIIGNQWYSQRKFLILFVSAVFLSTTFPVVALGQDVLGARELAIGQATTALPNSSWSVFANPAMISDEESSVSFFGVRYYGLSEVSDVAATVIYPTDFGVLAAGAHRYGFDLFNENRLRVGYKNAISGFHYGIVFNYSHVVQGGGYGSGGALGFDVGIAAPIVSDLWIAAKATNVNQPAYGSRNEEELPRNLSVGLSYQLSDVALFTSEVFKDVRFPIAYRGGIEVRIISGLMGRAGVTTSPQSFSAGFGYLGSFWSANVGVQRHENNVLGYSPAIDFKISW
ncbi:hypothetical protein [Fodinibius salsisoli]|uniref:MetA-pathway of phenol degradation n=1 Tax=Fodinibius salsisoli TaxID=2820877 RepID=A0ABT3PJF5_9BACT|nr:hypothetical protein [Fodinibius salsisoli]MCW9706046.1 hypothetical protein [Fodinibius salsisoli]